MRQGGRAGIVFPNGILFGDTGSHLEVKKRLLDIADRMAKQLEPSKSALDELFKMRRERDDTLCGRR